MKELEKILQTSHIETNLGQEISLENLIHLGKNGHFPLFQDYHLKAMASLPFSMNRYEAQECLDKFLKKSKNHLSLKRKKIYMETLSLSEQNNLVESLIILIEDSFEKDELAFH